MDRAFNNEIDYLIEATHADFTRINFRDGIHRAWFDMVIVRDFYRYVVLVALLWCSVM
jgi:predicted unusual protein kinase regulating ubiquinone biosynthesis (AarF/ABC1/UbiB family)